MLVPGGSSALQACADVVSLVPVVSKLDANSAASCCIIDRRSAFKSSEPSSANKHGCFLGATVERRRRIEGSRHLAPPLQSVHCT